MNSKKLKLKNSKGIELSAIIDLPQVSQPVAYAIFAHCFTCNKNLTAVKNIARGLTALGYGILRFDFTGLGESEGNFSKTDFTSNINDLKAVASYMSKNYDAPKLMIGHSLGGAAAIFASEIIDSIQATATIGAPSSPDHVQHLFYDDLEKIKKDGKAEINIGGRPFKISSQFIDDISSMNMKKILKNFRKSLLILHSPQDKTVGINNASEIYANAMHPKSFISLDGADHLLSNKADSIYVGNVIAQWAFRYIK